DPVVEVMTDKVTVQIPSPVTGKVLQLRAKEGEVVKVGATLVVFGEAGEVAPTNPATAGRPTIVPSAPPKASAPPPPPSSGEALAAPAVRRLAKELSVNLGALRGTGPQGRITEDDVRKGAQTPAMTPKPATATDEGLIVTVVHDADKKDLWGLAKELERLSNAAREKRLALEDVLGSTFTITSLGKEGGILATPIINWPEVAILGVHKIEKR